jgi:hypothetical protein
MKTFLIGDIHSKIDRYQTLLASLPADARSIQLGDVFLGRPDVHLPSMDRRHTFLQGNHDNPALCRTHENFLGGFGFLADDDLFFVSGAHYHVRKEFNLKGTNFRCLAELEMCEVPIEVSTKSTGTRF